METIEVDFICSAIICHVFIESGPMLNAGDILLNNNKKTGGPTPLQGEGAKTESMPALLYSQL